MLDANSNIPSEIARLRTGLATALDRDTKELPFIGELIQVVPDEVKWTGPIERLLRSFSLTVVVPQKLADEAEAFLEVNQLGDRLSFICPQSDRKNPKLHDDSVVAKLSLRPEMEKVRQTWLRSELAERFPHICRGERDEEFAKNPFALTLEGLVKSDGVLREKDDSRFLDDASSWVLGWDVSPKQRTLDDSLIKWREDLDNSGRALREAESERQALRSKLRAGAQLQACANEFSDIDQIGLATRIADLEEEERVIVGGSDVLKRLKEDRDSASEKLEESQNTRDEVLQRIGGVEARAERNETRMTSLRSLLVQSMKVFITESTGDEDPNEEDRDAAEEQRELLFK